MFNTDVLLIMGSFFLGLTVCFVKSFFHFDYLKQTKGKFKDADSPWYFIFRPLYIINHLPDVFTIVHVPILWNLKENKLRLYTGLLSYCYLALWLFTIVYTIMIAR